MHTVPVCSLLCRSVNQTLKHFTVGTAPKSSQILSSSPLLSWCESARLCLTQLTYSNVHWFKIHFMCQSMNIGLLGCLSLSQKMAFLLKKGRRQCIRNQSEKTRFSLSSPNLWCLKATKRMGPSDGFGAMIATGADCFNANIRPLMLTHIQVPALNNGMGIMPRGPSPGTASQKPFCSYFLLALV